MSAGHSREWAAQRLPSRRTILTLLLGYGVLALAFVVAVDVLDVGGLQGALGRSDGYPAWFHIWTEGSVTEWVQAIALLAVIMTSLATTGLALADDDRRLAGLTAVLGLGVSLMLLEDAGNVGQRIQGWVADLTGADSLLTSVARLPMLALAGGTVVLALWIFRDALLALPRAAYAWILAGFGVYALMAIIQTADLVFPLYERAGDFVFEVVFAGRADQLTPEQLLAIGGDGTDRTSELFIDFIYEETMELIGVALVVVGTVAMLQAVLRRGATGTTSPAGTAADRRDAAPGSTQVEADGAI